MDVEQELVALEKKLLQILPESMHEKVKREVIHLLRTMDDGSEQVHGLKYLSNLADLPWDFGEPPHTSFRHIKRTLDKSHYGMTETKDLILEYLSVMRMKDSKNKTPIFLLLGPPGVGKTSVCKAIGTALKRPVESIFMGGMSDPRDLVGISRLFQQSYMGMILKSYTKTKTRHSIIVLDEIDKCSKKITYTLLSVLDYSQNNKFHDMYIDTPYDLSSTIFIATANDVSKVHPALLDRMEIIELESYTTSEKIKIGRDYILPKVISDMGLSKNHYNIDQSVLRNIVQKYTREGGVRQLTRCIEKIGRKITREILDKKRTHFKRLLTNAEVIKYLGSPKYTEFDTGILPIGTVNGLAYTGDGGMVLTIEVVLMPTKNKPTLEVTGLVGNMSMESSQVVVSLLKSKATEFEIDVNQLLKNDIHIHYPECSAEGVDGPSAGGAMFVALYSLLKGLQVPSNIAMTGEITLGGRITEIGGLKEKLMAAARLHKDTVIIPFENVKDLAKVPEEIKNSLKIIPVKDIYELLKAVGF